MCVFTNENILQIPYRQDGMAGGLPGTRFEDIRLIRVKTHAGFSIGIKINQTVVGNKCKCYFNLFIYLVKFGLERPEGIFHLRIIIHFPKTCL